MSSPIKTYELKHSTLNTSLAGILHDSGIVAGFRGIPYGDISKRWTRATPHGDLGPIFDAREFGPKCPQPSPRNCTLDFGPYIAFPDCGEDDLNCLNLNVYCPTTIDKPLPVLVWIHGGSLRVGAGSDPIWDPAELVRWALEAGSPIIAVSINYRLGPFGFVTPMDETQNVYGQGNFGFHDQRLALEWVNQHIAGFGGDPEQITVGGESAGGCSTHAQTALQAKSGVPKLFRRAIMQSGNIAVMGVWNQERMSQIWRDAVKQAGLEDAPDVLEAMRTLPAEKLLVLPSVDVNGFGVFTDDYFLDQPFFERDGAFCQKDFTIDAVMHGDNGDEGNIFREPASRPGALEDLEKTAKMILGDDNAKEFMKVYELDQAETLTKEERDWRLHRIPEDARFYLPSAELYRVWPKAAFYHLSAKSPFSTSRYASDSYHTLDLLYLFGNFDRWLEEEGKEDDLRLGREIRTIWLKFIYGELPWDKCYQGSAAIFDQKGVTFGDYASSRGWPIDRQDRIAALQRFGAAKVVDLATRVFP